MKFVKDKHGNYWIRLSDATVKKVKQYENIAKCSDPEDAINTALSIQMRYERNKPKFDNVKRFTEQHSVAQRLVDKYTKRLNKNEDENRNENETPNP